jgi:DNA modification methylase
VTPYYADAWLTVYHGDARAVMAEMEPESVHCVVTSPPFWGLRDYGVPGQLGLEPTPEAYVESLVAVFREVRRVLRSDGTVWLNLGDSYNAYNGNAGPSSTIDQSRSEQRPRLESGHGLRTKGLKPKDLVGIPWRVAFALQADGWYLRSDIIEEVELYCPCGCGHVMEERVWRYGQDRDLIWSKPNPMPESVTDRPTKAHEYLFLLSKSPRYYYDADAVREPHIAAHLGRYGYDFWPDGTKEASGNGRPDGASNTGGMKAPNPAGRNLRSVWTIATAPYPGAHFATFPPKLVEPCIKAGTSERGVCPECGAPWIRETSVDYDSKGRTTNGPRSTANREFTAGFARRLEKHVSTNGWRPGCRCGWFKPVIPGLDREPPFEGPLTPVPATVLDPFAGSGTTGMVAQSLSRRAVLIDLSMDYLGQLMGRNRDIPLGLETA